MRTCVLVAALAAVFCASAAEADQPLTAPQHLATAAPISTSAPQATPPANRRSVMPWLAHKFNGADRPFDSGLLPSIGQVWPLYTTEDKAVAAAENVRGGRSDIVVEVCRLVQQADGSWGPPRFDSKERQHLCTVVGTPTE